MAEKGNKGCKNKSGEDKKTKVFFKTYGCTANKADSLYMKKVLVDKGYQIVDNLKDSDVVVINSCTVKEIAENKFWHTLKEAKKENKRVIAAGCVPKADEAASEESKKQILKKLSDCSIISPKDIASIATVVDAESRGEHVVYLDNKDKNIYDVEMPLVRKIIGILPISEGCLGNCSYCKTKYSRGKLLSYPLRDILRQAESYVKRGAKEIWLTSQDTGCYGLDIGFTIVDLLKELANIEGDFRVRIGMMNPNYAFRFRKEIADVINKSNKFFKFLHIPIQSGNDRVLKLMKRQYTTGVALEAVKYLKSNIKNLSFATDVICGFPTETDYEFDDTIKFIRETRPATLNISRFWPRPGTEAAKMKQFYNQIMIKRANKIREVFNEIVLEENRKWIGWEGRALFDEYGKSSDGVKSIILRNDSYKQIVVRFKELASDEIINEENKEKIRNEKNNYEIINDKEVGNKEVDVNNRDSLSENINEKKIDETNTNKEKSSNDEKIRLRDMRLKDIRLGDFIMVKVKDATTVDLRAEIIRND